ncbi:MAG: pantoate--beta-alanine ligase [Pseudomonadota bacterium]
MIVVTTADECRTEIAQARKRYAIGFVPTMGALHDGHLSLVRRSKTENPFTVMSIYVNPTQFGPNEDFDKYPRPLERDRALAEETGVDLLWTPTNHDIYPEGFSTFIEETLISRDLCGKFRPGHFRGVTTVVYHLLRTVTPDRLYLGQKDGQQLRVLEKMVDDLGLALKVVGCPTVREPDGLALSSRNAYLSADERKIAPSIYRALQEVETAFKSGERSRLELVKILQSDLGRRPELRIQYIELRRWRDFETIETVTEKSILAVAAYLGKTRLIDNLLLEPTKS